VKKKDPVWGRYPLIGPGKRRVGEGFVEFGTSRQGCFGGKWILIITWKGGEKKAPGFAAGLRGELGRRKGGGKETCGGVTG